MRVVDEFRFNLRYQTAVQAVQRLGTWLGTRHAGFCRCNVQTDFVACVV